MLTSPSLYLDVVATAAGRLEMSPQYVRNVVKKERNPMSGLITGLVLLALGALAAASSIVAKRPDAKAYIEMMIPYQGWFGFITCLWGAWTIISAIINLNWFSYVPVWWLTYLATGILIASLGLLLGYALLTKHIFSRSAEAAQRGEQIRAIIVPYQTVLGYAAIVLGLWTIVATFLYRI
ncbi:hypothetical protein KIP88_05835 [Bradyrhizobium sp. SRL28]|uniref:hypothetical protein n=1 Tax=Bradyrhizobium sp. SRL28 TaxID=2836178 RepID=UPI001BDF1885|nr:hypothetical protein [Bradyrhizobium sp. SRL28]MBT1510019.1 hypothetical protein [Bradyrhizobium sp. SRL28]